jgi:hypothetical protein
MHIPDKMMTWLSRTGLAIIVVLCIILACGCTSPQAVNLESPTVSVGQHANNSSSVQNLPSSGNTTTAPSVTPAATRTVSTNSPVIVSVAMDTTELTLSDNDQEALLTVIVDSESAPVSYSLMLDGPQGSLINGTFDKPAQSLGDNQWEYVVPFHTSSVSATGTYIWSNIRVKGENGQWSDQNPSVTFRIVKPVPTPTGDKPVFAVVSMDKSQYQYTINDSYAILTVIVNSRSPVVSEYLRLKGPNGNYLVDGNCSETVSDIGNDQWEFQVAYPISQMDEPGTYTWDYMVVTNANNMTSDAGPIVKFQVTK